MLDKISGESTPTLKKINDPTEKHQASETTLQMMLQKVIGQDAYMPSQEQVSKIIEQRGEIARYIREDRKEENDRFFKASTNSLHFFYGSLCFVLLISGAVLWQRPEYFTQVLSALLGFAGGFGVGHSRKNIFQS